MPTERQFQWARLAIWYGLVFIINFTMWFISLLVFSDDSHC